jgi:hypothetical protein
MRSQRTVGLLLAAAFLISSTGCLGTQIDAHTRASQSYTSLHIHLLAAPTLIRADQCRQGLSEVSTYVPLWGLAIGILTFGIVVPQWTTYTCAVP